MEKQRKLTPMQEAEKLAWAELVERNPERPGLQRPRAVGMTFCHDPSLTDQSQIRHCDLNQIAARYEKQGGSLPQLMAEMQFSSAGMQFGDFSQAPDFLTASTIVAHAKEQFERLSPELRNRFNGDPSKFLEWIGDEKMKEEHIKLGFRKEAKEPETTLKDVVGELRKANEQRVKQGSEGSNDKK